jgi:hypothetical protein
MRQGLVPEECCRESDAGALVSFGICVGLRRFSVIWLFAAEFGTGNALCLSICMLVSL